MAKGSARCWPVGEGSEGREMDLFGAHEHGVDYCRVRTSTYHTHLVLLDIARDRQQLGVVVES